MIDLLWELCNIGFARGVVAEGWKSAVTVPLYGGKRRRIEWKRYKGISLFSVVAKTWILL